MEEYWKKEKHKEEEKNNIFEDKNENIDNSNDIIDRDSYSNSTNKDSQYYIKNEKNLSDINHDNLLLKNKNYKIEILNEIKKIMI